MSDNGAGLACVCVCVHDVGPESLILTDLTHTLTYSSPEKKSN